MFFRDKAEPRGHISRASELPAISGCGDQGGCGARANPGDGHEPTRAFVLLGEGFDLAGDLTQTLFEAIRSSKRSARSRRAVGVRSLSSFASALGRSALNLPAPGGVRPHTRDR